MSDSDTSNAKRAYRILDWQRYERSRNRDRIKTPSWISWDNRLDGDRYMDVVLHEQGAAHLGAMVAICMVASVSNARGLLVRDNGEPHTAETLAYKTRLPVAIISEALKHLEAIRAIDTVALQPQPTEQPRTKRVNGHAQAEAPTTPAAVIPESGFDEWWSAWCKATERSAGETEAREKWKQYVKDPTAEVLTAIAACSDSYFQSREVANHRVTTAARFIEKQSKEGWRARWPNNDESPRKPTVAEAVKELAQKRIASGRRPM